jgi:FAD/FMN-containing dehydrogenase/Fe-S oxidoreductase
MTESLDFRVLFDGLNNSLKGDLFTDEISLLLYSTDASAYKERPLAVARPKTNEDIRVLIQFARKNKMTLIPRTAGTSLAGQVVGKGIVVDVSRYMTKVLEFNKKEKWVRVQPGVVLDELNEIVSRDGLFFGPETSTANRCMIGGMVGNNACGAHSLIYGSTRDHTLEVKGFLSDGSEVEFGPLTKAEFEHKCEIDGREGEIYRGIKKMLGNKENQEEIVSRFPEENLKRRNTGYALDLLLQNQVFSNDEAPFNFSSLIAGSEGTLLFITEIKLNLVPLPPREKGLICVHFHSLEDALQGNLIALKHKPGAIELIDRVIMDCTRENIEQKKNRFFIKGEPAAILVIEFARETRENINKIKENLEKDMLDAGFGYHFPLIFGDDIKKVWALRKAGLGLLSNIPGDAKPVSVIEDTAVNPEYLPDYIKEFKALLQEYNLNCVYHAHIATGELHLRPVLNLKDKKDVETFHSIAEATAKLVKKYKGSLSGEHGDGRLRGEFIPLMIGNKCFQLVKDIKHTWDPDNVFNANKIVDTPAMNTHLRYKPGQPTREIDTIFDFSSLPGILRMAEKCNGSGDCRKTEIIGGTMCPSYMATRDESTTTRARANVLREFLTQSPKKNPFDHKEIYDILDLCLSCKGCKSECPSNVDMAKMKAEFLQHYYDANGIPLRSRVIAFITHINKMGMIFPSLFNFVNKNKLTSSIAKKLLGFAPDRSIPGLYKVTLRKWARVNLPNMQVLLDDSAPEVNLFVDEFSNYNDVEIGIKAIKMLTRLGYKVTLPSHGESGRTYISKGFIRRAKKIAENNVILLKDIVSVDKPLVGIEPSAILSFRDEYPDLLQGELKANALELGKSAFLMEEFLAREIDRGKIKKEQFTSNECSVLLHGHCQQKAVASTGSTRKILSFPENYSVREIKSGCCGMAGSFGYEKEHYDLSMKVGELVLFPEIRKAGVEVTVSAPGTSCRHQIKDGTGTRAMHPLEIFYEALI